MNNNTIYLAVTVAFMIGLAIIGIMISRGVKSSEDWMVAGKSLGKIPMAGTYFATIVSATSIMSYMGYYYLNGWPGWWNAAGTLMTSFLACIYFARKVRQSECNTLPEFIEKRYSRPFLFRPPCWSCCVVLPCWPIRSLALSSCSSPLLIGAPLPAALFCCWSLSFLPVSAV